MLKNLIIKLERLKDLKNRRDEIFIRLNMEENHIKIIELISKGNTNAIYELINKGTVSEEDFKMINNFIIKELIHNFENRSFESIEICIKILLSTGYQRKHLIELIRIYIKNTVGSINQLRAPLKVSIIESIKSMDKDDLLGLHSYINGILGEEIQNVLNNKPFKAVEMDKRLNELMEIYKEIKSHETSDHKDVLDSIVCEYKKSEICYFNTCFKIILKEDKHTVIEDLIYLVHKIQKRSNHFRVNIICDIRDIVFRSNVLETSEDKKLFNDVFMQ